MENNFIMKLDLLSRFLKYSHNKFLKTYINSQKHTIELILSGKPYILCTYYFPSEIISCFDIECLYIERIVGLAIGCHILSNKENSEIDFNGCSYHKAFLELINLKIIPLPERIIAVTYPCNDAVNLCKHLEIKYGIPTCYVSINNMECQLQKIYDLLKNNYSVKKSISEVVNLSNEAISIKKKIDVLRMCCPGIIASNDCLKIFTVENDFGNETAVTVLKNMFDVISQNKKSFINPSGIKIFWMGLIPLYNNNILSTIERLLPCSFVYEEMWNFGDYKLTKSKFFADLENKIKSSLFYDTESRINKLVEVVLNMEIDIVINFTHVSCSFLPKKLKIIMEKLKKKGIKMYNVTGNAIYNNFDREILEENIKNIISGVKE